MKSISLTSSNTRMARTAGSKDKDLCKHCEKTDVEKAQTTRKKERCKAATTGMTQQLKREEEVRE
jgi:tRNA(Arg) A34 adenosine deaminase TadA